ncbi:MAG: APC family permease [Mycoplasma sp.]|nr:APC family permease [Mycoplasma sp.]
MEKEKSTYSKNKISFFSAILVVIGSSIGAGIFFKSKGVLENSQNSLVLAIFCWIIAALSVIAMALALVEISSARNDNLSVIGWIKVFNSRISFKSCKNFMFYLYTPLTFFYMPLYVIVSLQDGIGALISSNESISLNGITPFSFGTNVDWLIWTIISFSIFTYFLFVSGISAKIGNIQNKIVTYVKFMPLIFVAIIGFVLVGMNAGGWNDVSIGVDLSNKNLEDGLSLSIFTPGLGMFIAISAIFFAYDGFYVAAGIQSEMAKPKKTPMAILIGLAVTTIIYLVIAISMSINGGSFTDMARYMTDTFGTSGRVLFGIINIMISIGVFGIINGFSMWTPRFIEDLIKEGELPFSIKYKNKLNEHRPIVGIMYAYCISIPIVIIFSLIGSLAYIDVGNYGIDYGKGMGELISFADLMSSWTAVFIFGYIALSIFGGVRNRRTLKAKTIQKKYFLPMAIISIIIVSLAVLISLLVPIIDLILIFRVSTSLENYNNIVISRVMLVVVLIIYAGLSYGIIFIEDKINIKKYGSIENYEKWQKENFIVS